MIQINAAITEERGWYENDFYLNILQNLYWVNQGNSV